MGYGYETKLVWSSDMISSTADSLTVVGDASGTLKIAEPIRVVEVGFLVSTTVGTTGATIKFDRRVKVGSDSGRGDGDVDDITIPAAAAAGKYYYSQGTPIDLDVGDEIVPEVTVAGGTTGAGYHVIKYFRNNKLVGDESDAVESA